MELNNRLLARFSCSIARSFAMSAWTLSASASFFAFLTSSKLIIKPSSASSARFLSASTFFNVLSVSSLAISASSLAVTASSFCLSASIFAAFSLFSADWISSFAPSAILVRRLCSTLLYAKKRRNPLNSNVDAIARKRTRFLRVSTTFFDFSRR